MRGANLAGAGLPLVLICTLATSVGRAALAKMKACALRPFAMGTRMERTRWRDSQRDTAAGTARGAAPPGRGAQ